MRAIQPLRELVGRFDQRRRAWTSHHPDAINWFNVMRLGLFQLGLGLSLAPLTGTLNRVLIAELGIPASMVGFLLAIHFFVSPIRAIMGFRSDKQRAEGRWRTPYVVLGAMLTYGGLACAPFALLILGPDSRLPFGVASIVCAVIFLVYGIGVNIVETMFLALVSDITPPKGRGRVLVVMWMMLVIGTIISALFVGQLLIEYNPFRLIQVLQGTAMAFVTLTAIALWRQEKLRPDGSLISDIPVMRIRLSFGQSLRRLSSLTELRWIFLLLFLATGAFATHDVLLEPYGAQILSLSVSQTTELTVFWGLAMLVAIGFSGIAMQRGRTALLLVTLGCGAGALGFLLICIASNGALATLFRSGVTLMGLGRGLFVVGSLALVLNMTRTINAGFLLGLWGVVQALAQGVGTISGGVVRDVLTHQTGNVLTGYVVVYIGALLMLVVALVLLLVMHPARMLNTIEETPWSALQDIPADQLIS